MQNAQELKKLILAGNNEITVEQFEKLVAIEKQFSPTEFEDLYNTFKLPIHGGKFTAYAEVIFKADPSVDKLRQQREKKAKEKPIQEFFPQKGQREEDAPPAALKATKIAKTAPPKTGSITSYFKKK